MDQNNLISNEFRSEFQQNNCNSNCYLSSDQKFSYHSSHKNLEDVGASLLSEDWTSHPNTIEIVEPDLSVVKKELEDTEDEWSQLENVKYNLDYWNTKQMSIQCFKHFIFDCSMIAPKLKRKGMRGPLRLVSCPSCLVEFKNVPDRLIRMYNHIIQKHKKNTDLYLLDIIDRYEPLICFMIKMWKIEIN